MEYKIKIVNGKERLVRRNSTIENTVKNVTGGQECGICNNNSGILSEGEFCQACEKGWNERAIDAKKFNPTPKVSYKPKT